MLANLIAVPITGFWITPWALVTLLAMPFGLDRFTLIPMGWGVHAVIRVAETVSSLRGAVVPVAAMPDWGLIAVTVGGSGCACGAGRGGFTVCSPPRSGLPASSSRRGPIS